MPAVAHHEAPGLPARPLRPWILTAGTLAVVAALTVGSQADGRLHVIALDVGQGDAILVRSPDGRLMLVDGGPDPDVVLRRLGSVLPFWQRKLDLVVLTHPHEDHVAGLVPVLERFQVRRVLDPGREYANPSYRRFVTLAGDEGPAVYGLARAGERLVLGSSTQVEVLYPSAEDALAPLPDDDVNNASVVLVVRDYGFAALLTGDAEAPVEQRLLKRGLVPDVDLLKVGHHGSESSTTPAFLAAAKPEVALISCGVGNDYGHPHAITLEHLGAIAGLVLHRTDLEGTVDVAVDPGLPAVARHAIPDAGSIGPWWFPAATRRWRCSSRWSCRTASSSTPRESPAWLPRPPGWLRRPAYRWTCGWSRSPPCCMTSTSWRPARPACDMASWPASASPSWVTPSWRRRSNRTR
jgi:beta-lactamase superfamily II metal-dependent hydrolase